MQLKIGCCGFPVAKEKYYKNFEVVEIQQTFYQLPEEATALKWRVDAPKDFEFTLKAWQLITHQPSSPTYKRLKISIPESKKKNYGFFKLTDEVKSAWEETEKIVQILKSKIIVFQCPASFTPAPENKKNLKAFFKFTSARKDYLFAWEPRGRWEEKEIISLCKELELIPILDPFKNKTLHKKIVYLRLHGKTGYRYKYTDKDLRELMECLVRDEAALTRSMHSKKTAYCMFNNIYMFEDALRFKKMDKKNLWG